MHLPRNSVASWADLCEQFVGAFQGGYQRPGTRTDLQHVHQKPGETLRSFIARFCKAAHRIPNAAEPAVIKAFRHNVRNVRLREELAYREPTTTRMLFKIASMCERMEEGRRAPELVLKDQDEASAPKKKKRKREDR